MARKNKSYKIITKRAYSLVAGEFAKRDRLTVAESCDVQLALKKFIRLLPKGGTILDVGCGTGRDSAMLFRAGFKVLGIDFSKKMIEFAKKINPRVEYQAMDLENIKLEDKFDGIWANASLHHIPKSHLPLVLRKIGHLLVDNGVLFIKVKHGSRDELRTNFNYGRNITRWFAFYGVGELKKLVRAAGFKVLSVKTTTKKEWVDIFARK